MADSIIKVARRFLKEYKIKTLTVQPKTLSLCSMPYFPSASGQTSSSDPKGQQSHLIPTPPSFLLQGCQGILR